MADLTRAWSTPNLRRAWLWTRTNPDRAYKSYFRELYSAYAVSDGPLIAHLHNRLRRGLYEPSDACKLLLPKSSGILRPYSLLGIEDQIVYQAMINVIAERLFPFVRHRYNNEVFGHLYAGSNSLWFYRKWTDGYGAFNKAAEAAYKRGYVWAASFDLTACYDSIDHNVLRHMLSTIGIERDLRETLTDYLSKWTATATRIYHQHGIPQGPLGSGLVAEAVLRHFDDQRRRRHDVKYFRYVDDIRLMAREESHLRHELVELDRLSKDVGLFPQSSKIYIHEIKNIKNELKSISNPIEALPRTTASNQAALRRQIVALSPRYEVKNPTRFKYVVARATPSSALADRLWRIYERAPRYYSQIASHLSKFKSIPDRHALRLLREIDAQSLYPTIQSVFIDACDTRLPTSRMRQARSKLKRLWKPRQNQPDLSRSLWRWLSNAQHLTEAQTRYGLLHSRPPWLQMALHFDAAWSAITPAQKATTLNQSLRSRNSDVALAAAWLCGAYQVPVDSPIGAISPLAKVVLRELGLVRRANANVCGIQLAIEEMTRHPIQVNWKRFFGKTYRRAEAQMVRCKGFFKTDASSCVNALDVFVDLLLDALYRADPALGIYTLGNFGPALSSTRFRAGYPNTFQLARDVHHKRLESDLSHARVRSTQRYTGRIRFSWLRTGARLLLVAARELHAKGY